MHTHDAGDGRFFDVPCSMLRCPGHLVERTNHRTATTYQTHLRSRRLPNGG